MPRFCQYDYPPSRLRAPGAASAAALRYGRIDGRPTETTAGDTDAELVTFSGQPDAIVLSTRAFPALFTLTDRLNRETTAVLVPVNNATTVYLKRDRILVRNAIAGSNAIVTAVGLWAEPDEPGVGPETN